jgi:hypothetical protein
MTKFRYAHAILVGAFLFFLTCPGGVNAQERINVLLVASEIEGYENKIEYYLSNIGVPGDLTMPSENPVFDSVDWHNLYGPGNIPELSYLNAYDCVVTWSNFPFRYASNDEYYADDWGDRLAEYVDAGGAVIICTFCFTDERALAGDIFGEGYSPLTNNGVWNHMTWSDFDIPEPGSRTELEDELYTDVDKLGCGWRDHCSLESWAGDEHFSYLDGEYAFAYSQENKVAAINMYPGSAFTAEDPTGGHPNTFNCFYDWKDINAGNFPQDEQWKKEEMDDEFPEFLRNVILWLVNEYNP